jgi:hypothetical protein
MKNLYVSSIILALPNFPKAIQSPYPDDLMLVGKTSGVYDNNVTVYIVTENLRIY